MTTNKQQFTNNLICDYNGLLRSKVVNNKYATAASFTQAVLALPSTIDAVSPDSGLSVIGEVFCKSEYSISSKWIPGLNLSMSDLQLENDKTWDYCPRSLLKSVSDNIKSTYNLEAKFGLEVEFIIKDINNNPIDDSTYA